MRDGNCDRNINSNADCNSMPNLGGDSESIPAAEGTLTVQPTEMPGLESDLHEHIDMLKKS
ncbi:hypothetical protein [Paenibacillus sp. NPDC058174]|uniref:hypothetical protein n=1 Tax=Paenibacillus sp. NPDC058174 TaxID=3346366 RepID=UPI0036DCBF99